MRYIIDLDPHQIYSLIGNVLLVFFIISLLFFIFVRKNVHLKFLNKFYYYLYNNINKVRKFVLILSLVFVLGFFAMQYVIYDVDKSTKVEVDEKIVIMELDDYWNFEDAMPYLGSYGYTFERYRDVSDIIDKYGFVATLGVTPYIFIESKRINIPLIEDGEMISYLKELQSKGYELGMHGYNHCRNQNYCPQYEEVWYNVFNGKMELEEIFGTSFVSYFPPGNAWTTEQYENVKKAGFLLIGNTHVPHAYLDEGVIITNKGYDPIDVYDWYGKDFRYTSYNEWIEDYKRNNLFIIQLHANTFDSQEKLDDLDKFLKYVKDDGAKVMTYKEFYYYIKEKRELEGKDMTGKIVIES